MKSSGIFFVGTVMTKLISFLLLPLYTSYISPGDYGIYDLHLSYVMFFSSVLYFDIWSAIMRFMYDFDGKDRKKPISCGIAIFLCSTVMYCATLALVLPHMQVRYPVWLTLYGALMNGQTLVGYIARGYGKNVLYTASGVISSLITILFNIIFLVWMKMDYSALLIASCIGYLANILIVVIGIREPHAFSLRYFNKKLFREMFRFSLPLCVNSVAYWFLTSYNRLVVDAQLGAEVNGYYAIAGRFGSMITLFTTCFQMAWQELSFSKTAKENNLGQFYSVAINNYVKCMGAGLVMLIPMIYIVYPLLVNNSYDVGKSLVPVYLMGTILSTISTFLGNAFTAIKKNNLLLYTMIAGSVANVISIHLLIGPIGLQASNLALVIGFLVTALTRMLIFKYHVKIRLELGHMAVLLGAFVLAAFVYQKGSLIANMIVLLGAILLSVYMFKDFLIEILKSLKNRKESKTE